MKGRVGSVCNSGAFHIGQTQFKRHNVPVAIYTGMINVKKRDNGAPSRSFVELNCFREITCQHLNARAGSSAPPTTWAWLTPDLPLVVPGELPCQQQRTPDPEACIFAHCTSTSR